MIIFYRLAFPFLALLLFPYYLKRMIKRGGYGVQFFHRGGFWPSLPPKSDKIKRIWIQAVSVGELSSIQKLIDKLSSDDRFEVVLSSTTSTGLAYAREKFSQQTIATGPFPLDWWPCTLLGWSKICPDLIITIDSELWPEHFEQARQRGVPVLVLNARLSDRTFSRLSQSALARSFLLPKGLEILATSERQRGRWLELGVNPGLVHVSGNLKVDSANLLTISGKRRAELREEFGFRENSIVLCAISSWPGEEELLIQTILQLGNNGVDARLLIIPRHAERRRQISKVMQESGLPFHLRSEQVNAPKDTVLYLADTTGELAELIQAADLGWMGKTLAPNHGGQNPIEPISIGLPLVCGPNYQNFSETCADLLLHDALIETGDHEAAKSTLIELAQNSATRNRLGYNAKQWMVKQGSPTLHSMGHIMRLLEIPKG